MSRVEESRHKARLKVILEELWAQHRRQSHQDSLLEACSAMVLASNRFYDAYPRRPGSLAWLAALWRLTVSTQTVETTARRSVELEKELRGATP